MFHKRKNITADLPVTHDFNIENLVVSGASFTYNNSEQHACTWPYYLKILGNFKKILDCSLPGAGNFHIAHSLQWNLGCWPVDPDKSLVVVMWSNNTFDDTICALKHLNQYPFQHYYTELVCTALSGGSDPESYGNVHEQFKKIADIKDNYSRSIENFLYITGIWAWLKQKGYRAVFLDYSDKTIPSRSHDIDIKKYLPKMAQSELDSILTKHLNLYNFAVKKNLLSDDDYHPHTEGHLCWTKEILIPLLQQTLREQASVNE